MNVKIGDTVRYLNAVGGGRVTRIADNIAYVDEDGFETPVLLRECVVVAAASSQAAKASSSSVQKTTEAAKERYAASVPPSKDVTPEPTRLPVVETASGNVMNVVLGFEAVDIKALSRSSFEAYIVNDSNYYIYVTIATRANEDSEWTHRYDGLVEPNIQEFAFEIDNGSIGRLDRIAVQYVAFKRDRAFENKRPGNIDIKVDNTKFAKLHCFRPNPYFDAPVIAFDIVTDDRAPIGQQLPDAALIAESMKSREASAKQRPAPKPHASKSSKPTEDIIEVDLHASELLDNVSGLSAADILNLQIDRFSQVMDASLRHPGRRIVFIHGKGEGVLRQALMKELTHRYKGHDVQDASFREYGFGATQVTIRPIAQQAQESRKKKR